MYGELLEGTGDGKNMGEPAGPRMRSEKMPPLFSWLFVRALEEDGYSAFTGTGAVWVGGMSML